MRKNLKKLLLVVLATALSITQLNIVCQAKLKPGQFNKEMLKWLEPYKEREDVPDSWTWYPEYDRKTKQGELPYGAKITNELDEETGDLFYDHYWLNDVLWGGFSYTYHSKSVGLTRGLLDAVSNVNSFDRLEEANYSFEVDDDTKKFSKNHEFVSYPFVCRQTSKDIELYTGTVNAGILVKMELYQHNIRDIKVYIAFTKNGNISSFYDITSEYLLHFSDFSYNSLEKALDKFNTVCYNYNSYIGAKTSQNDGIKKVNKYCVDITDVTIKDLDKLVLDFKNRVKPDKYLDSHIYGIYTLGLLEKYLKGVER